ncbi:MAG: LamG domain-containing protein [Lachnospiraceae bacterium]|nr:LamG domain-containing protein [Lachnospiraceae bacterium]
MKKKLLSVLLCGVMTAGLLAGCGQAATEATEAAGETAATATAAADIPSDYKYYYSFDQADDNDGIVKVTCDAGATMVPVEREKNYIPGVKGEALYNDGVYGYDLSEVNGVGNSYTIAYWTYCQRSALYMPNTIWGPDIKGNKDIGAEQWAAFDWLASDDDSALQVFPGIWSNEGAGVGRAEWKAAGSDSNTGHWMHLALVVDENSVSADGNLNIAKVYVNGQEVEKKMNGEVVPVNIVKTAMVPADSFEFLLGINYWDAVFKGAFDELYIYDYALSAEQVAGLAADGDPTVALEEPERVIEPVESETFLTALGDLSLVAAEDQYTSDVYALADGGSYKFTLKNWSDGKESTDNYILKFAADGANVATIYADATGSLADGTDLMNDFTYSWGNWNTWLTSVMMEATPVINVSRDGSNVTVKCDNVDIYGTAGTNVATITFDSKVDAETPLELTFTNKNSYVEILEAKDTTPKAGGMIVGATDCSSGFFTEFSPIFSVPEGASVTKSFTNYTSGVENWHNFVLILQNTPSGHSADQNPDYAEYAVVRADNYGWGAGYEGIVTPECDWNWDSFKSDMDGAKITATITNNGDTADIAIVAETTAGKVYHQKYDGIKTGGDLYACFSLEQAYLSFDTLTVGATDCSTGFWGPFSDIYAVPEGESRTVYFKNYNDGGDNWHNFYVVLQNVPAGHGADANADYAEYAVVRADNYGWGTGYEGIVTPECDWDWGTFMADTNGASVELTVTNNGDTADVVAVVTSEDGKLYHQNYPGIKTGGDLYFCIGGEASYQLIEKQKVGASDCTTAFWGPFSDIVAVPEGETVYRSFVNYNDGGDNWHNFYVVLQNTPAGHSADEAEGYAEYAVVRADNYGWGTGYEGIVTPECDWDWATFMADSNEAAVLLAVTNNGDTADVVAYVTTAAGKVYTQTYKGIKTGGDLYFCIGGEASYQLVD